MSTLSLTAARNALLWRALWSELDRLRDHPDNAKYRTGREAVLAEMREIREMLREINAAEKIVSAESFESMLSEYMFESPFTVA
jgi:hypothetical protein